MNIRLRLAQIISPSLTAVEKAEDLTSVYAHPCPCCGRAVEVEPRSRKTWTVKNK